MPSRRLKRTGVTLITLFVAACGGDERSPLTPTGPGFSHPDGVLSKRIQGIPGRPFGIAVSATGLVAVTQQDLNTITLVDVSATTTRTVAVGGDPGDVVFNSAGTRAWVSNFNSGTVSVIDVASASVAITIPIAKNAYRLVLSADESRLFVSSTDGRIYVVNLATNTVSVAATIGGSLQGMTADASKAFLYVTSTDGTVTRVSSATFAVSGTSSLGGAPQDVVVSPNGTSLYVANESTGRLDVLDPATLAPRSGPIAIPGAFGLAFSPDGKQLYVSSPRVGLVSVVDVASGATVKSLSGVTPRRIAFDHVGAFAVIADEGNFVDVIR